MLPKEAIEEFKKLYFRNYKIQLSDKEATRRANNLVALYGAIYNNAQSGRIDNNQRLEKPYKKSP